MGVGAGEAEQPDVLGESLGADGQPVGVRLEQRDDPAAHADPPVVLAVATGPAAQRLRGAGHPDGDEDLEDLPEALVEGADHGEQPLLERLGGVDHVEAGEEGGGVGGVLHHGVDELLLGLEDPVERALGDAGGGRDVLGAHRVTVLAHERPGGVEQDATAFVGGKRFRTWGHERPC